MSRSTGTEREIGLCGVRNARDLGGIPLEGGGVTAFGRFLRTDAPVMLSEEDKEYLEGVSIDVQKRLDEYMAKHVDSIMIGEFVINIFNTTNLLQDYFD